MGKEKREMVDEKDLLIRHIGVLFQGLEQHIFMGFE